MQPGLERSVGGDEPRGAAGHRISRRRLLRSGGLAALALPLSGLVACDRDPGPGLVDVTGSSPRANQPEVDWDAWWAEQRLTGHLDFANWPYYIDRRRDNSHPSLDLFTSTTGIEVAYYRPIRDNASFLELIRPALEAGEPIGYDLIVISNGPELAELIGSGWVTPLDHTRLPHFEWNAGPLVRGPLWDPGNRYSVAWQSGLTGIAYTPEAVEALGYEPSSIQDLWHPALSGKVGMMSDLVELGSVGLLAIEVDPAISTRNDWLAAAERLRAQREAVAPRYYDQGYTEALARRDTWISLAWSGDVFQLNNLGQPDLRFVVPSEGAMLWTDNMLIPMGAPHPLDALSFMDFVYRPRVAAMIADWVWYICPVPAAKPIVAGELGNPDVARSPLVFPGPDLLGDGVGAGGFGVRDYYVYADATDYAEWVATFEPIVYS